MPVNLPEVRTVTKLKVSLYKTQVTMKKLEIVIRKTAKRLLQKHQRSPDSTVAATNFSHCLRDCREMAVSVRLELEEQEEELEQLEAEHPPGSPTAADGLLDTPTMEATIRELRDIHSGVWERAGAVAGDLADLLDVHQSWLVGTGRSIPSPPPPIVASPEAATGPGLRHRKVLLGGIKVEYPMEDDYAGMEALEGQMEDLYHVMGDMAAMVHSQGAMVESIAANSSSAVVHSSGANVQLAKASRYQAWGRGLVAGVAGGAVGFLVAGPVGLAVGLTKGLAGAVGIGGAVLGGAAGRAIVGRQRRAAIGHEVDAELVLSSRS